MFNIDIGYRAVRLPWREEKLYLIVIRGMGTDPMMLLTNIEVTGGRKSLVKIVLSYIRRWQIEDSIRFAKQSYRLEDIRLLTYQRLQNMMVLVMAAMYFACVWLGEGLRLRVLVAHVLKAVQRIFGISDFRYYAIADGIKEIFAGYKGHLRDYGDVKNADNQLALFAP